jgi:hypothetical protein
MGKTDSLFLDELPAPMPTITVTNAVLSTGVFTTYQWYFEGSPFQAKQIKIIHQQPMVTIAFL